MSPTISMSCTEMQDEKLLKDSTEKEVVAIINRIKIDRANCIMRWYLLGYTNIELLTFFLPTVKISPVMELRGIEPLTSTLRTSRSPN